jgi:type 1 glutamine amidotransferase
MKRLLFFIPLFAILLAAIPSAEARIAPLRVVFVSGSAEYDSDKTMPILKSHLEKTYPSIVTMISAKGDDLPGTENLAKCELVVLFTRRLKLQGEQLENVKKYCTSGKPIVGIRTASHGVQSWLEFDREILGGYYKGHYSVGPVTDVKFTDAAKGHPILKDVKPFKSQASLYKNSGLAKDVTVLLTGSIPDHEEPIAWTRMNKTQRVFYTSLGGQKDFEDENFLKLMTNGILWAADRAPRTK